MTTASQPIDLLNTIGWREWISLPDLGMAGIKAKIDTGARSSTLHAFDIEVFKLNDSNFVRFKVCPYQFNDTDIVTAEAELLDIRNIRNSGGQSQSRPVIKTSVMLGEQLWPIELTLTNRDVMGFRMLLGRQAVRRRFLVDSGRSYLRSSRRTRKLNKSKT
ncbi:MAG: ATP-dependent zinc protease [Symploca sp. SIO2G7]|nr:ATP-dependent zinc protease [Symploca sp. SIO2G7]